MDLRREPGGKGVDLRGDHDRLSYVLICDFSLP
jgi:hypothetical protein